MITKGGQGDGQAQASRGGGAVSANCAVRAEVVVGVGDTAGGCVSVSERRINGWTGQDRRDGRVGSSVE